MKKVLCLLLAAWTATVSIYAQSNSGDPSSQRYLLTQKKYTFAIQPLQQFNNGWRFDFEMRLNDGPSWLQFGPTIYSATGETDNSLFYRHEYFLKLRGGGLDVNYKEFFNSKRSLYTAAGLSYNYFNIEYSKGEYIWIDYTEDGLPYHEQAFIIGNDTQHIHRIGANYYIGYQAPFRSPFLFDMFLGLSYRYSFSDKNKPRFNEYASYGYSGWALMIGVRIGFGIR